MTESLYFSLVFLAAIIGLCTAVVALRYRDRPGAKPLVVLAGTASIWALVEAFRVVQAGVDTMVLWTAVGLTLSALVPPAILLFAIEYTGNDQWLTARILLALLVEPLVYLAVVWTNDSHGLVWTAVERISYGSIDVLAIEYGVAFWGHLAYSYLLLALAALFLLRMAFQTNRLYQWQGIALLVAILVPMGTNALASFGIFPPGLDPSGIASVLSALVLLVTVLEAELLAVAPATREIGREAALTELDDAVVILDDTDRIVDCNPAANSLFDAPRSSCRGNYLAEVSSTLASALAETDEKTTVQLERDGRHRYFDVRASELSRGSGLVSGRIVSVRDVTERRQREQRLDVLNRLLRHNVRNKLTLVRGKMDLTVANVDDDEATANLHTAIDAVDVIVDRTEKLGRFSRLLDAGGGDQIDVAAELRRERDAGGLRVPNGELSIDLPDSLLVTGGDALVGVFEELVSNAVEHNDSPEPRVDIRYDEDRSEDNFVVIEVSDNGPGIAEQERRTFAAGRETPLQHSSGVGLWLVNWVVERAGGTVSFENDDGCVVRVRLPQAKPMVEE